MKYYKAFLNFLYEAIKYAVAAALLAIIGLMVLEVIRRYFFSKQFTWSEEFMRYVIVWVAYVGGAAAFRRGSLVCFDMVSGRLTGRPKVILDLVNNTVVAVFVAFNAYLGYSAVHSPSIARQISPGLQVPVPVLYWSIPIGCFFMVLFAIENYFTLFARLKECGKPGAKKKEAGT